MYLNREIKRAYIQQILGIKRRRFCALVEKYKKNMLKELAIDKKLIVDKTVPLFYYNYSYIQSCLQDKYKQSDFLRHGLPVSCYVDSHFIFRFVRGRDEIHYQHHLLTDKADLQWKQVLDDCNVNITYAFSPQAKDKIERPYRWIQDRLVRTCARVNITEIKQAQCILAREMHRYNYQQVHSTTQEIPYQKFQRALKQNLSLFRSFAIKLPYLSTKDIFCLRLNRKADACRRILINNILIKG